MNECVSCALTVFVDRGSSHDNVVLLLTTLENAARLLPAASLYLVFSLPRFLHALITTPLFSAHCHGLKVNSGGAVARPHSNNLAGVLGLLSNKEHVGFLFFLSSFLFFFKLQFCYKSKKPTANSVLNFTSQELRLGAQTTETLALKK